ncbi:MAG: UDP-N-acetylmuramyl-tripeptide synthetase [Candidatus Levyibacteriota bacterium]|nr:MAG: UDP-N-acetylmuramyl-tripeptide synthetase [Candidatus Levybacteria bacterium]
MWQSIKNIYHLCNAFLANVWYGFPAKKLTVIGVTGTDGKTTTTNLIYHILKTSGKDVSMISTVGANINGKEHDVGFHVTTPSSWQIQKFLARVKGYLVLETTSHALDQNRIWGVDFTVGVLTNVTHEHLDYHKTYENYVKTKSKLLEIAKVAVVNRDDVSYEYISKLQRKNQNLVTYGLKENANVNPKVFSFKSKLFGEFNKYNILAAVAVCKSLGIVDSDIRKGIETFRLPAGRAEIVYNEGFTVMIDFAHTPNSFAKLLLEVKKQTKGRLIHVFGAAGLRDISKRPLMGKESAKYADIVILTAEDPRSESIEKIMDDIQAGIKGKKLYKIANRQEAINTAIKMAKKGDFVVITGKSHEQSMNYGKGEKPWNEFNVVKSALKNL